MANISARIIQALKDTQHLTQADIDRALSVYSREGGGKLKDIFVRLGLVTEKELLSILSAELRIPFFNLAKYKINRELGKLVPEKLARKYRVVPVSKIGNALTLAMLDPFNIFAIDDVALFTHLVIQCVISTDKDIEDALNRLYAREADSIDAIAEAAASSAADGLEVMKSEDELGMARSDEASDAPIVRMVDLLIREALKKRASDIHIEPFERTVKVRYRIDGNLEDALIIPKKNQNGVVARIKIMSRMDITENRVPQDGRFKIKLQEREVDFRVSALPCYFGNKVVMRILDKSAMTFGLDRLGFLPQSLENVRGAIAKPFGMILVTGPTGSGKSTTLYSILSQLNSPEKNIVTIEDPIEYQMKGVSQIQTKPDIGLDFANGLRAILRQSPDIVMVGEIRDFETADIAIKASLTGQLVLSTLHTNDAAGAMTRLMDMGVEPFLIASSIILVAAQRLCRKLCPFCREKAEIPREVFERMGVSIDRLIAEAGSKTFFRAKGCAKCSQTGYFGRMGILETLVINDEVKDMIIQRASSYEIKELALKKGMVTLREDALKKFALGLTTLDEVIRVTSEDQ